MRPMKLKVEQGFTLVEVMLSVSIIVVLAGLTLPLYTSFIGRTDVDTTAQSVAAMLRRAQTYSRGINGDSQWGVAIQSGSAILFKGGTYATRDASYDETLTLPGSMSSSGLSEVVFSELAAAPNTTGSITLASNTNDIRTISINAKGTVSY